MTSTSPKNFLLSGRKQRINHRDPDNKDEATQRKNAYNIKLKTLRTKINSDFINRSDKKQRPYKGINH